LGTGGKNQNEIRKEAKNVLNSEIYYRHSG